MNIKKRHVTGLEPSMVLFKECFRMMYYIDIAVKTLYSKNGWN